jgi:hypothetical protein
VQAFRRAVLACKSLVLKEQRSKGRLISPDAALGHSIRSIGEDRFSVKQKKPISLRPLKFKEAVADLLKVKPPAKPPKAKAKRKKKSG